MDSFTINDGMWAGAAVVIILIYVVGIIVALGLILCAITGIILLIKHIRAKYSKEETPITTQQKLVEETFRNVGYQQEFVGGHIFFINSFGRYHRFSIDSKNILYIYQVKDYEEALLKKTRLILQYSINNNELPLTLENDLGWYFVHQEETSP